MIPCGLVTVKATFYLVFPIEVQRNREPPLRERRKSGGSVLGRKFDLWQSDERSGGNISGTWVDSVREYAGHAQAGRARLLTLQGWRRRFESRERHNESMWMS